MKQFLIIFWGILLILGQTQAKSFSSDICIVGGTPGGISSAISAAREGKSVVLLVREKHLGGLIANGLGATDIATLHCTRGVFTDVFVNKIWQYYNKHYSEKSSQVRRCRGGYRFEPHVAEQVLEEMLTEYRQFIVVKKMRQFDALPQNVKQKNNRILAIKILNRQTKQVESYQAKMFIDATYEGDLMAASGCQYRLGRESRACFNEKYAGQIYQKWGVDKLANGSTGLADNAIQAYNYRLFLLKKGHPNFVPISKPAPYNRQEYISLIDDLKNNRLTGIKKQAHYPYHFNGIGRVINLEPLPNGVDGNNQHLSFLSTDLPEENWPWPTANWQWRDQYALRLKNYIWGLIYFAQNDSALPQDFRKNCQLWGFSKKEYQDNDYFPRQVYVREGRRLCGKYVFTAQDALPSQNGNRPPVHADIISAGHYYLDSHGVRRREATRVNLDGFFSQATVPYTIPYRVMVPKVIENLIVPVAVSASHVGFSTLRMEPHWMALGHAAGKAVSLALENNCSVQKTSIKKMQEKLLQEGAILIYFKDVRHWEAHHLLCQKFGLKGFFPSFSAQINKKLTPQIAKKWCQILKISLPSWYKKGQTTRLEFLKRIDQTN